MKETTWKSRRKWKENIFKKSSEKGNKDVDKIHVAQNYNQ
jgi:hypothetical protein